MTKKRSILVIMIVSLVFNAAFLGSLVYRLHERSKYPESRRSRGPAREHASREHPEMSGELRKRMHEVHERFSPRIRELRGRIRGERDVLMGILMAEDPDSTAVENQLRRIGEFQLDLEREVVHRLFREKDLLPLEQRRQFLEMVTRRWGGPSRRTGEGRKGHRMQDKEDEE